MKGWRLLESVSKINPDCDEIPTFFNLENPMLKPIKYGNEINPSAPLRTITQPPIYFQEKYRLQYRNTYSSIHSIHEYEPKLILYTNTGNFELTKNDGFKYAEEIKSQYYTYYNKYYKKIIKLVAKLFLLFHRYSLQDIQEMLYRCIYMRNRFIHYFLKCYDFSIYGNQMEKENYRPPTYKYIKELNKLDIGDYVNKYVDYESIVKEWAYLNCDLDFNLCERGMFDREVYHVMKMMRLGHGEDLFDPVVDPVVNNFVIDINGSELIRDYFTDYELSRYTYNNSIYEELGSPITLGKPSEYSSFINSDILNSNGRLVIDGHLLKLFERYYILNMAELVDLIKRGVI